MVAAAAVVLEKRVLCVGSTSANSVTFHFSWTGLAQSFLDDFMQAVRTEQILARWFQVSWSRLPFWKQALATIGTARTFRTLRCCSLVAAPRQEHTIVCSILAPVTASTTSPRSQSRSSETCTFFGGGPCAHSSALTTWLPSRLSC